MISKEEMKEMTAAELEAYMRGYRDGQVDLREILYTNVIPVAVPSTRTDPAITWSSDDWKAYLNGTFGFGGDTIGKYQESH